MIETLPKVPDAKRLSARALGTMRRKPGDEPKIVPAEVRVAAVYAESQRLAAYREICGFPPADHFPITYPQVLAAPLHLTLMLREEFPLPLLGIVHVRNRFSQEKPLATDTAYDVRVALTEGRRTQQGFEFDIVTEFSDANGQVLHRALMTPLYRIKSEDARVKPAAPQVPARLSEYRSFDAPADIGRRYAPIAQDFNPIHLYALTARLFGFPRAIAHGMWSLARAVALLEDMRGRITSNLDVRFRQPLLLPGKAALKFADSDIGAEFALLSRSSDKLHFTGSLS